MRAFCGNGSAKITNTGLISAIYITGLTSLGRFKGVFPYIEKQVEACHIFTYRVKVCIGDAHISALEKEKLVYTATNRE
jgi:hypothetical protein